MPRPKQRDDLIAADEIPTEGVDPTLLAYWLHKERMLDKVFRFVLDLCPFVLILVGLILVGLGHSASDVKSVIGAPVAVGGGAAAVARGRQRRQP